MKAYKEMRDKRLGVWAMWYPLIWCFGWVIKEIMV